MADGAVYRIDVDSGDAQQKVEKLDESTKSLSERMESMGGAGRELGSGISGGAGQGMSALDNLGGALDSVGSAAEALGSAGLAAGIHMKSALDDASSASSDLDTSLGKSENAADSLGKAGADAGGRIRSSLEDAASASDSMGMSFAKNFNKAEGAGKSFAASIKTGIIGALDTAKKKTGAFVKGNLDGAKKIGNAFLHPIQTIKGKFSGAMKYAEKGVGDVGDEAKKSGNKLDEMGKSGVSAGDKLQKGFGAALKVIGAVAAAAALAVGIAKFTTAAVGASQAAENISYSFNKAFGESSPDIEAWAGNFSKAVHRSESEVKGFLSSNKQLYEGLGITGQAANDLSKATTSLAYDIGNKFGVNDAEALSGLQDAISGNEKALSAYGVNLDKTTLQQTALNMGVKGSLDDLDEATLAQIRFNSIIEQTGDIQQSATKSLGGFAGGVKALKAGWTDFLEKAGDRLAPTFDKIFGVILEAWPKVEPALMSLVDMLAGGFEQAAPIIGQFVETFLPQLLGMIGDLAPPLMEVGGQLLPLLAQVLGTVVQAIGPLMPLISTLISTLLPPLTDLFGMLVSKLLPPLATLFGAIAPVIDALSPILTIVASAIGLVADAIAKLIGWLTSAITKVGEFAQSLKNSAVGKFVSGVGEGISNFASNVFGGHAKGTNDFEGGWTRVHEAGGELIQAKHSGGLAYLPQGSAVIPASKTEEILSSSGLTQNPRTSSQPNPNWIPVVLEGNSSINPVPTKPEPDDKPNDDGGSGGKPKPPPPPPPPNPVPTGAPGEIVSRKVIDINVNVTSSNGSVPPDVIEEIAARLRAETKEAAIEAYQELQNSELSNLAIQNGLAG